MRTTFFASERACALKNRKPKKWHPVFDYPRARGSSIPLTVNGDEIGPKQEVRESAAIALARYLVPARGLDPWRRPKGSWALGARMLSKL